MPNRFAKAAPLTPAVAAFCWLTLAFASPAPAATSTPQFQVEFDPALQNAPYTGRVYVVMSRLARREPRFSLKDWFNPPQVVARDVANQQPGVPVVLDSTALAFPRQLGEVDPGDYHVQAIARRNADHPVPGLGPGDLVSEPQKLTLPGAARVSLKLIRVVEAPSFHETDRIKLVEIDSPLLSAFQGRPVKLHAGVLLPAAWQDADSVNYPTLYWIGGFGSTHEFAHILPGFMQAMDAADLGDRVLQVVPDPSCYRGHHVFADSPNNGPWARALLEELIPYIERQYHAAGPSHRYVTGMSSGGWSSLWLQVNYPDQFNGCWAHTPDPVDFRDFQRIDLYDPQANMYTDASGAPRPLARHQGQTVLNYRDFVRMEEVIGPGGQIHSFEAVFSARRPDGSPAPLFDRATGKVDPDVARSWQRYDIRMILEHRWAELAPRLAGKLHIYAGEQDTFFLDGAVRLLSESLARLGSDAEIIIVPGMAHQPYRERIRPMYDQIVRNFGNPAKD